MITAPTITDTNTSRVMVSLAIPPFRVGSPPPEEWSGTPLLHYPVHKMMAQGKQQNSWDRPQFTMSVDGEEFLFCVGDGTEQGWANGRNPCQFAYAALSLDSNVSCRKAMLNV